MNWKIFTTEEAYKNALKRTIEIFHAENGSQEAEELDLLLVLVKDYEDKNIQLGHVDSVI